MRLYSVMFASATVPLSLCVGQGLDLLETRGWDELASGVIEA